MKSTTTESISGDSRPAGAREPSRLPRLGTETPIPRLVLMAHQHMHVATSRGVAAHKNGAGVFCLFSDHFDRVVNLTPIWAGDGGEDPAALVVYPDNVECKVLYVRDLHEPRWRGALRQMMAVPAIVREVRRADLVYVRLPHYPAFLSSLAAAALGKDMMVSIHGDWSAVLLANRGGGLPWRMLAKLGKRYYQWVAKRSMLVFVTGAELRGLVGSRAILLSNHQFTDRDLHERADTCQSDPVRLLYVGRLSPSKGIDYLLDAMALMQGRGGNARLTLVGPSAGYNIADAIARRGLGDRVVHAGPCPWGPALFAHYRQSDIFVFPSLSEGLPKAPMEALSQSLPVVSTPPGTSMYVDHERSGLIVPSADAKALAGAIERMIDDGELRRRCIAEGFAVAKAHTREKMHAYVGQALREAFGSSG